jgi:hypothetical protein
MSLLPSPLHIIPGFRNDDGLPETGNGREPEAGSGNATGPVILPVPVAPPGTPSVRGWLSAAAESRHLGGGPDGLAAHLADPHPEPLKTHLRHAGDSARAVMDRGNQDKGIAAGKAAYCILIAIPVKLLAKTVRHTADILDWAADAPSRLILAAVIIAVIAAVFLLS